MCAIFCTSFNQSALTARKTRKKAEQTRVLMVLGHDENCGLAIALSFTTTAGIAIP